MAQRRPDHRSPLGIGLEWSTRITTIGLEIAVPALVGWWLDERLGTEGWLVVVGAVLGAISATLHLVQMVQAMASETKPASRDGKTGPER